VGSPRHSVFWGEAGECNRRPNFKLTPKPMRRQREARNSNPRGRTMKIGELKEMTGNSGKYLVGAISTLSISLTIELKPAPKSESGRGPDYIIYAWSNAGVMVKVGGAWIKSMVRGANAGDEFITLTIDDPSLRQSLNVAAFKNAETDNWDIIFRRRQEKAA
jgi:uncharacterized protein (DUF736 family)